MRSHLDRRTPGGGTRERTRGDRQVGNDAVAIDHRGLGHEDALLASNRGHGTRGHREGAQGGHAVASEDRHAEVSVLAEAHGGVDHCDHLLLRAGAGLVRAVVRGRTRTRENLPGPPCKRQSIFWVFPRKSSAASADGPNGLRGPPAQPGSTDPRRRERGPAAGGDRWMQAQPPSIVAWPASAVTSTVSPLTRASTSSPYLVSLDWP